jgi:undecaprenyl-diphosphatase
LLIAVTSAARGGGLWWAVCAGLASRPGRARRTAAEGAVAVAAALAGAHVLKRVLPPRRRPPTGADLARQELPEHPTSSSMPSAHAASGAAFVVVVMSERCAWGFALLPVALAVGYGRVRTKVHWLSDVLAGAAVGLVAGAAVRTLAGR